MVSACGLTWNIAEKWTPTKGRGVPAGFPGGQGPELHPGGLVENPLPVLPEQGYPGCFPSNFHPGPPEGGLFAILLWKIKEIATNSALSFTTGACWQ